MRIAFLTSLVAPHQLLLQSDLLSLEANFGVHDDELSRSIVQLGSMKHEMQLTHKERAAALKAPVQFTQGEVKPTYLPHHSHHPHHTFADLDECQQYHHALYPFPTSVE